MNAGFCVWIVPFIVSVRSITLRRSARQGKLPGSHVLQSPVGAAATAIRTSCNKEPKCRASLASSTESPAWWANL